MSSPAGGVARVDDRARQLGPSRRTSIGHSAHDVRDVRRAVEVDFSRERKRCVGELAPSWSEGLDVMSEGDKARFWIPEKQPYNGRRGKPKGDLAFDIELLKVADR